MELEISQIVIDALLGSEGFTAVLGAGDACKLFPMVADEGTPEPYAIYRIDEMPGGTKDGAQSFSVSVGLAFGPKGYMQALSLKNVVKEALDNTLLTYVICDTDFDPETQRIISFINYEITGTPA